MTQTDLAHSFQALHQAEAPLLLYNVWDAATARACVAAGAKAVATGSHSVAAAQGYDDGEAIPFDVLLGLVARIAASVELPLSVDFEAGYADSAAGAADNLRRLIDIGVVGVNIEDQKIGDDVQCLRTVAEQAARIAALRHAAEASGVDVFINARTDLFLKATDTDRHEALLPAAVKRARAYQAAGASGFFVPRLSDALVGPLCAAVSMPVNVMATSDAVDVAALSALGVSRISHGPFPFIAAMQAFAQRAKTAYTWV